MKLKQFFRQFFGNQHREPELPDQLVHRIISRLENTREDELSCDEVFAMVDVYAEASQRGEDLEDIAPLLRHHLEMCRECDEEYQALIQVLESTA